MFHFKLLPSMFTHKEIERQMYYFDISYAIVSMAAIRWSRPVCFKCYSKFWNCRRMILPRKDGIMSKKHRTYNFVLHFLNI